jgi:hypothetical protein
LRMNEFLVEFGAPFSSDGGILSNIQLVIRKLSFVSCC